MTSLTSAADSTVTGESIAGGGIMLFGVRVMVDSMRKSVSMNDISQYKHLTESNGDGDQKDDNTLAGYASADDAVHHFSSGRERKRGVPWTEEEHKLFLLGLQKVGKGDWRGISRNFVKTRTPTQVASHAQKYFLRRSNLNRRRRRSSLFDITTDTVTALPMEEDQVKHQDNTSRLHPPTQETRNTSLFPVTSKPITPVVLPAPIENPMDNLTLGKCDQTNNLLVNLIRPTPVPAPSAVDLNLNLRPTIDPSPLSLKLSLSTNQNQTTRYSAFQAMSNTNHGDSVISVA